VAPQPGVYAGQVPPPAYAGMYGYAVPYSLPAVPRQRTGLIVLAQVLMVVKGVFWLIAGLGTIAVGIYLIVHGGDLHALPGYRDQPGLNAAATGLVGVATGFIIAVAVALLAIGIADIALGITVGRLSNVARWLTVALDVVAGIVALSSLIGQLNHRPTAGGAVFAAAWLVTNIVIFYALVIDPRSRQAFG
jgi:hypothetical protein